VDACAYVVDGVERGAIMDDLNVAIIVGSLRRESFTRKVAEAALAHAPARMKFHPVDIGNLPHFNQDREADPPAEWSKFRSEVRACVAVLFFTPEYNRSFPGVLKNAIDVGSRPEGKSVWNGMPAGVVSVTPYKLGAFGANHALRQTFVFLNMPVMQQPEAYIGNVGDLLDKSGKVTNSEVTKLLEQFMSAFEKWVEKTQSAG
jgi:NAD(P)H-dependent FMN reductase